MVHVTSGELSCSIPRRISSTRDTMTVVARLLMNEDAVSSEVVPEPEVREDGAEVVIVRKGGEGDQATALANI